jgi:hypothetical protein
MSEEQDRGLATAGPAHVRSGLALDEHRRLPAEKALDDLGVGVG